MAKKKEQSFHWSREASRVQVLGADNIRVSDHEGLSWVLDGRQVDSARKVQTLLAMVGEADPECRDRIYAELPERWRERADRVLSDEEAS